MNKKKSTPGRNKTAKGSRTQIARRSKRSPARASSNKKEKNTKRILPIIICSFLALLLVFGIVLGTIALIKEMRSVVSYNGVRIDKGVASYLAATYKATYKGDKKDTAALDDNE